MFLYWVNTSASYLGYTSTQSRLVRAKSPKDAIKRTFIHYSGRESKPSRAFEKDGIIYEIESPPKLINEETYNNIVLKFGNDIKGE